VAHHAPLSQYGFPAQVRTRPVALEALAIPGPEAIRLVRIELHRDVQPHSLARPGYSKGIHPEKHAIDIGSNSAGIQSAQWRVSGYNEIQSPPSRYRIIDLDTLFTLGGFADHETFASRHLEWVESSLSEQKTDCEPAWTESIAIGPKNFVVEMRARLGMKTLYRPIRKISPGTFVIEDA